MNAARAVINDGIPSQVAGTHQRAVQGFKRAFGFMYFLTSNRNRETAIVVVHEIDQHGARRHQLPLSSWGRCVCLWLRSRAGRRSVEARIEKIFHCFCGISIYEHRVEHPELLREVKPARNVLAGVRGQKPVEAGEGFTEDEEVLLAQFVDGVVADSRIEALPKRIVHGLTVTSGTVKVSDRTQ